MHASTRLIMDRRISTKMSRQLRTVWQASTTRHASSLSTGTAHKGSEVSTQVKIQRIQVRRAWRPCGGSSSTYPSVMISVTENISHGKAKMCRSTITHVPHSCSDCQWLWQAHVKGIVCKLTWQSMGTYQTITNNPCPHTDAELLELSTQSSFSRNSQIKCFRTRVDMDIFSYVELVPKVCPRLSVTFCTQNFTEGMTLELRYILKFTDMLMTDYE
jgi:hypothetical protein